MNFTLVSEHPPHPGYINLFIYLFGWCFMPLTQECMCLSLIYNNRQHYCLKELGSDLGKPKIGCWKTFLRTAGKKAGMSWTFTYCDPIGQRLLGHSTASATQPMSSPSWLPGCPIHVFIYGHLTSVAHSTMMNFFPSYHLEQ